MSSNGPTRNEHDRSSPRRARGRARARLSARELLRTALVNDDDPRFPWWLPLPGLVLALAWAAYQAATASSGDARALEELWRTLLWPGAAIFVLTTLATFFGWQLDID